MSASPVSRTQAFSPSSSSPSPRNFSENENRPGTSSIPDEFDELLRTSPKIDPTFDAFCCTTQKTIIDQYLVGDPTVESNGRFDLLSLLRIDGLDGGADGTTQPATAGRSTPPLAVLEQIEKEDDDKLLMEAQSNLFTWSFLHGNFVGAQYEEGDYDLDTSGEQVYAPMQGFFNRLPTYRLWWTENVVANDGALRDRFHCSTNSVESAT